MDKTLIVYDNVGTIQKAITGSYIVPVGIPYLEVEIPPGQHAVGVDVTEVPHVPVISDPYVDPVEASLEELHDLLNQQGDRAVATEELAYMAIETAVAVYEAVYPFLPRR